MRSMAPSASCFAVFPWERTPTSCKMILYSPEKIHQHRSTAPSWQKCTLQIGFLLGWAIDSIVRFEDSLGPYVRHALIPLQVHRARDQTRGDHTSSRSPTTHLTVEDEISGAVVCRCNSLEKLRERAWQRSLFICLQGVRFMRYKNDVPNAQWQYDRNQSTTQRAKPLFCR
jgi:hypothetical protein